MTTSSLGSLSCELCIFPFPFPSASFLYKTSPCTCHIPKQARAKPWQLRFSPKGDRFTLTASDRIVRVFDFLTGKLFRAYDESVARFSERQAVGVESGASSWLLASV